MKSDIKKSDISSSDTKKQADKPDINKSDTEKQADKPDINKSDTEKQTTTNEKMARTVNYGLRHPALLFSGLPPAPPGSDDEMDVS